MGEVYTGCLSLSTWPLAFHSLLNVGQSPITPGVVQMPEEKLGGWYPWWSYIFSQYQVLKSAFRQKPYVINSSFI